MSVAPDLPLGDPLAHDRTAVLDLQTINLPVAKGCQMVKELVDEMRRKQSDGTTAERAPIPIENHDRLARGTYLLDKLIGAVGRQHEGRVELLQRVHDDRIIPVNIMHNP